MIAIVWLAALVVFVVVEILTMGLTTIWFAGGALVAFIVCVAGGGLAAQIILFFAVSCVLLFFTRPIAKKRFNHDRIRTNAESLIGKQAVVLEPIDNLNATGLVQIQGQEWTARSVDGAVQIEKDTVVVVTAIEGVKLIVTAAGEDVAADGEDRQDRR